MLRNVAAHCVATCPYTALHRMALHSNTLNQMAVYDYAAHYLAVSKHLPPGLNCGQTTTPPNQRLWPRLAAHLNQPAATRTTTQPTTMPATSKTTVNANAILPTKEDHNLPRRP